MQAFLSYHEDEQGDAYASALQGELRILGIDATMARHSIRPGADWALTIREHLEASSALLCIGTTGYTKRVVPTGDWMGNRTESTGPVDTV
mgnify:CR=1 FL=1